ncbi:SCP2 sterol-binding domain-containing protein [Limtongia smithiae]|uniref:SCP2 sterol-binding domain-containing protein n=1 Tax=Limtongia smithiae TaxID=1125753 RepID=UPI0034CFCDC0
MPLKVDAFPSSTAFDLISDSFADEKQRKSAIKQGGAIFAFTITNKSGQTESWYLDLKTTGAVGKGVAPDGKKADVTLSLSDENFQKLINGKLDAQKLFMRGQLKIKGDLMKATKVKGILEAAREKKAKL